MKLKDFKLITIKEQQKLSAKDFKKKISMTYKMSVINEGGEMDFFGNLGIDVNLIEWF